MIFQNRQEAGKKLAEKLQHFSDGEVIVSGLARGGVVVAAEIAKSFGWPLDVMVVRKIGAPDNEELALGAIAEEGEGVFNDDLIALLGVSRAYLQKERERQREKIKEWKHRCLGEEQLADFTGKAVVLVDDGVATGASMQVAVASAKARGAKKIVLAIPVGSSDAMERLSQLVDRVICLSIPSAFHAVGAFYKDFEQVSDEEIVRLIRKT